MVFFKSVLHSLLSRRFESKSFSDNKNTHFWNQVAKTKMHWKHFIINGTKFLINVIGSPCWDVFCGFFFFTCFLCKKLYLREGEACVDIVKMKRTSPSLRDITIETMIGRSRTIHRSRLPASALLNMMWTNQKLSLFPEVFSGFKACQNDVMISGVTNRGQM